MGNEATCNVRWGKRSSQGKALLETNEVLFRGDFRLKIPFSSIRSATTAGGELRLQTEGELAVFELGPAATNWLEKILHPKSRINKLGVKLGATISLIGSFDADFLREAQKRTSKITDGKAVARSEWIFFAAESAKDLSGIAALRKAMKGAAALWVVYPKGQQSITEKDVLTAGRKAGLKDVKVVGFSPTHTALKFVIPVSAR